MKIYVIVRKEGYCDGTDKLEDSTIVDIAFRNEEAAKNWACYMAANEYTRLFENIGRSVDVKLDGSTVSWLDDDAWITFYVQTINLIED